MNGKTLQKGCILNDKEFAKSLKQIAANIEDGELGISDAMDLIERASMQHTRTAMILVRTMDDEE